MSGDKYIGTPRIRVVAGVKLRAMCGYGGVCRSVRVCVCVCVYRSGTRRIRACPAARFVSRCSTSALTRVCLSFCVHRSRQTPTHTMACTVARAGLRQLARPVWSRCVSALLAASAPSRPASSTSSSSAEAAPARAPEERPPPKPGHIRMKVDGREIEVPRAITAIEACRLAGVNVPHFCYHERLSVAGNCRMCLVEVEKMPKLAVSCALPVMEGMHVITASPRVKKSREMVLEFLLKSHPLDCPICGKWTRRSEPSMSVCVCVCWGEGEQRVSDQGTNRRRAWYRSGRRVSAAGVVDGVRGGPRPLL